MLPTGRGELPLTRYINGAAFEPEVVAMMTLAFEDALARLKLSDRTDPLVEILAKAIIACAHQGERDASACADQAIRAIGRS